MIQDFLDYFQAEVGSVRLEKNGLLIDQTLIPIRNGIPRFSSDDSYSSGNFSRLREEHATLQLDSRNGTNDRRDTLLARTKWSEDFFKGKTILECGCGAGPDTEVLLSLGAKVVSVDLAGLDVAQENLGERADLCLVQASIDDLPFKERSFDIVFCHRVIMHTPFPEKTLDHILRFVKPGGDAFVHSYSRDFRQMFRWKYLVRPLTKRVPSEKLYKFIRWYSPVGYWITSALNTNRIGRRIAWIFVPFINHAYKPKFKDLPKEQMLEYGIHETFDAMSPAFDKPLARSKMDFFGRKYLDKPFEVSIDSAVFLLRTKV